MSEDKNIDIYCIQDVLYPSLYGVYVGVQKVGVVDEQGADALQKLGAKKETFEEGIKFKQDKCIYEDDHVEFSNNGHDKCPYCGKEFS